MKIAILVWDLNVTGGTQRMALELALNLEKLGHTVDIYCYLYDKRRCYTELCERLNIYAVQHNPPAASPRTSRMQTLPKWLQPVVKAFFAYRALLRRLLFPDKRMQALKDLMEKHGPFSSYDIINVHDYEVHNISRIIPHPCIVWTLNDVHKMPIRSWFWPHQALYNFFSRRLANEEVQNIARIVVLDTRNKKFAKVVYNREAQIVRCGGNTEMFKGQTVPQHDPTKPWTIFASSIFFPYRRFEDIVDAVELLVHKGITNLAVRINGVPNRAYAYYEFIRNRVQEKGLGKYITITTGMSEEELKNQYLSTDIFIFPNNNQTWGLAIFEGMLAGSATIVSRGSGGHEVLTDKENALLVNPCAPQEIADAIEFLTTHPEDMRRIQKNGVEFVKENLSWEKYAARMQEVFEEELAPNHG